MQRNNIIVGIDIGSHTIRTVVGEMGFEGSAPRVLAIGSSPASGVRRGLVVDIQDALVALRNSISFVERASSYKVQEAYVGVGGVNIEMVSSHGLVAVSRADSEVSSEDVERVLSQAQAISLPPNKEIIHVIPKEYIIDGVGGIKDVVGMKGVRLEVNALLVLASSPFIANLEKLVAEAGVNLRGFVLSSLAASRAVLSKRQRELGSLVVDIGGATSDISVFEEGDLVHSGVFPVGSSHITNDIAIGLKINIDLAEKVKLHHGTSSIGEINKREIINLAELDPEDDGTVARLQVIEIIEARLVEIFSLVSRELKSIKRDGLLPAGVVLVGGGSKIPGIVDLAKRELRLPVQLGFPLGVEAFVDTIDDPSYSTVLGLILWADDLERRGGKPSSFLSPRVDRFTRGARGFIKSLLP